jgi:hypothetical protein
MGETQMTYIAYEMTNSRPTKVLFQGAYGVVKARAEKIQAAHYAKHQEHKPIFITAEIMAVGR